MAAIQLLNNLESTQVRVGQRLKIPTTRLAEDDPSTGLFMWLSQARRGALLLGATVYPSNVCRHSIASATHRGR